MAAPCPAPRTPPPRGGQTSRGLQGTAGPGSRELEQPRPCLVPPAPPRKSPPPRAGDVFPAAPPTRPPALGIGRASSPLASAGAFSARFRTNWAMAQGRGVRGLPRRPNVTPGRPRRGPSGAPKVRPPLSAPARGAEAPSCLFRSLASRFCFSSHGGEAGGKTGSRMLAGSRGLHGERQALPGAARAGASEAGGRGRGACALSSPGFRGRRPAPPSPHPHPDALALSENVRSQGWKAPLRFYWADTIILQGQRGS